MVSHSGRPTAHPNGGGGALPDYKPFSPTNRIKKKKAKFVDMMISKVLCDFLYSH
jgi:hypothetical protein